MTVEIGQHQAEIEKNLRHWRNKPLLQSIYAGFYRKILDQVDRLLPGKTVELGSGIGNLKTHFPAAISTDLFPNPWVDLTCDAYDLPFRDGSLSHLLLFDVFHHLEWPLAFFSAAKRVLIPKGRVILFEPFISTGSYPAYGLFHHEPVGWRGEIDGRTDAPDTRKYYAAQGNATRLFFSKAPALELGDSWRMVHREAFSAFGYLLSGGYSKPALYPMGAAPVMEKFDRLLTRWPRLFGGRCLVVLEKAR